MATYLDDNGNPVAAPPAQKQYLDPNTGEPIKSPTAPPAPPEGFWHSLAAQFGMTPEAAQAAVDEMKAHPLKAAAKAALGPAGAFVEGLYNQVKQSGSALGDAATSYAQGNAPGMVANAVKAIPIVGPAMDKAADQYADKDYAGVAGTLTGAAAQAAPMVAGAADAALPANRPVIPNPPVLQAAGKVALLGKTPEGAYESAMKPSPAMSAPDRAAIVQTGLQNEIPVSKAGVEKIGDLIDTLNTKIKDTIAADPNRPIDPNAVATRADIAKAKFANQVNAQPDLNAIEASKQQFLTEQGAKPGQPPVAPKPTGILDAQGNPIMDSGTPAQPPTPAPDMSAADAQKMKQGTYQVLKGKYGEQGSASVEAQKALARGLKEEIATQFPEISGLNQAESRLLDLQPVLERAVNRISNHQAIGIGTPIAGAAAEAVTGSTGVGRVAMVMKAVLDNPNVKSRLAIAVSKANKIPIATAMNRVNLYSASLGASAAASQANSNADNPNPAASTTP